MACICISGFRYCDYSYENAYSEGMRDGLAVDEDTRNRYIDTIILKSELLTKMMNDLLVSMDEDRITQVIYNLIENAVKYMDKDDMRIFMKTWYDKNKDVICVAISDNGPGISMTDIPYVFDRFYRAEKSRSTSIPGSGLGLSICKYIVEAHGGEIRIDSWISEGTTFTFEIVE